MKTSGCHEFVFPWNFCWFQVKILMLNSESQLSKIAVPTRLQLKDFFSPPWLFCLLSWLFVLVHSGNSTIAHCVLTPSAASLDISGSTLPVPGISRACIEIIFSLHRRLGRERLSSSYLQSSSNGECFCIWVCNHSILYSGSIAGCFAIEAVFLFCYSGSFMVKLR